MEENVWTDPEVKKRMLDSFVVVSLYVDERRLLPASAQMVYDTKDGAKKNIITVGDKWATFQSENFNAVSQPQYALISPDEKILTYTKGYTPKAAEFTPVAGLRPECLPEVIPPETGLKQIHKAHLFAMRSYCVRYVFAIRSLS